MSRQSQWQSNLLHFHLPFEPQFWIVYSKFEFVHLIQHCYIVKIYNILLFVFEESCQPGPALKRSPTIFFSLFIFQSIIMLNPFTFSNRFKLYLFILVKYCDLYLINVTTFFFTQLIPKTFTMVKHFLKSRGKF